MSWRTTAIIAWQAQHAFAPRLRESNVQGARHSIRRAVANPRAVVAAARPVGDGTGAAGHKAIAGSGKIALRRQQRRPQGWNVIIRPAVVPKLRVRGVVPDIFLIDRAEGRARIPVGIGG